ncbi:hypothetical protein GS415_03400 [Rhodococcus hoagii]|nr:hypothetical protein [Prescottella equi]
MIRELEDTGKDSGVITTYKGDGVVPDRPELPARWHRVAAATAVRNLAADGVDTRIIYAKADYQAIRADPVRSWHCAVTTVER